jgi:hypothetical protein
MQKMSLSALFQLMPHAGIKKSTATAAAGLCYTVIKQIEGVRDENT